MSVTALVFIVLYGSGLVAALFGRPIYGLMTYFFVFYLHPPSRYWGASLPDLRWSLLASTLTLFAVFLYEKDKISWLKWRESKLMILFFCFVWLQSFWAISPALHSEYVTMLSKFIILYILISIIVKTEKDLLKVIVVNIAGCGYLGWVALSTQSGGRFEASGVGSPGINSANLLSMHVSTIIVSSAFILLCAYGKKKYLLILPIVFALNLVFLTQSRGAAVALVVTGLLTMFFMPKRVKKQLYVYMLLAAIGGISLIPPGMIDRLNLIAPSNEEEDRDSSANSRIYIVKGQFKIFKRNPIFGHGHRGTLILSPRYIDERFLTRGKDGSAVRASHNLTMSLLVDHGAIGASLYFLMLYLCIKRLKTASSNNLEEMDRLSVLLIGMILALINLIVASQFSNSKVLEIDIWLFALISATSSIIYNKKKINEEKLKIEAEETQ